MSLLETSGVPEAIDLYRLLAERAGDMRPVWPLLHQSFLDGERKRFADEGPGWAPLRPSTVARKGFGTILVESGAMRASLTDKEAPGHVYIEGTSTLVMGTDYRSPRQSGRWASVALASFHQLGTTKMVARPVIDPEDAYVDEWAPIVADYIVGAPSGTSVAP